MTRPKNKTKAKVSRDPLPEHFNSLEEAGDFWDSHDSADYDEYFKPVEVEVDIERRTHLDSFDDELYRKVRAIAKKKGIAPEKLVRLWVEERAS